MEYNQKLQEAVSSLIQHSLEMFDKGASFLSEEIPEVVHQLLYWEFTRNIITTIIGIALLGILFYLIITSNKRIIEYRKSNRYDDGFSYLMFFFVSIFGGIPAILFCISLINLTWLKILIAPKIFLIEYAASFLK